MGRGELLRTLDGTMLAPCALGGVHTLCFVAPAQAGEDVLLVLDDLGGLIGFTDDMMRLSAQPDIEHGSQEDSDRYDAMVVEATVSERRRFWGTALQVRCNPTQYPNIPISRSRFATSIKKSRS